MKIVITIEKPKDNSWPLEYWKIYCQFNGKGYAKAITHKPTWEEIKNAVYKIYETL